MKPGDLVSTDVVLSSFISAPCWSDVVPNPAHPGCYMLHGTRRTFEGLAIVIAVPGFLSQSRGSLEGAVLLVCSSTARVGWTWSTYVRVVPVNGAGDEM